MKKLLLLISMLTLLNVGWAQTILNSSFEIGSDTSKSLPKYWSCLISKTNGESTQKFPPGISAIRDNSIKHSGKYSLKMSVNDNDNFVIGCSQKCDIHISSPQRIKIVAWIKTKDCTKGAGINCTQSNDKNKRLDYTSSRMQETLVMNTQQWTKTTIDVLLRPDAKRMEVSALLYGAGTVWFDDISIEKVINSNIKTSPIVTAYLDTLIKIVKGYSLYKDSIKWNVFPQQLRSLANGMQTYKEARLLGNYIINELHSHGDHHSSLMSPASVKIFSAVDIMGRGRVVESKYLGDGIGYVSMPGFGSSNDSIRIAFATNAQEAIKKTDTENNICAWVVDLREDDGGSCPPMIAGLGPVLGEGVYGRDVTVKNDSDISIYKDGASYLLENGKLIKESETKVLNPYKLKNENVPVAVLIGPHNGSSGECAVAAFIGRHDTKLFGQPTGGFTKGNEDFTLADSSMVFIASDIQTDRNGKKYPERIFPDIKVEQPANSDNDITLNMAKEWLNSLTGCKKGK